jgi:hypothetical protein
MSIKTVHVTVDIHFINPAGILNGFDAIYRIYFNKELLVERSWSWGNKTFLKENICVDIDLDNTHIVSLESIFPIPKKFLNSVGFIIKNLQCTNEKINIIDRDSNSITFRIV